MLPLRYFVAVAASLALDLVVPFAHANVVGRKYLDDVGLHRVTVTPASPEPIPPLQDPWYTAPENFERAKPGAVLRLREAPGNLTSLVANCSAAYNILYRTTNSQYKPDWAVTTVFVPLTKTPALLSYQIP